MNTAATALTALLTFLATNLDDLLVLGIWILSGI